MEYTYEKVGDKEKFKYTLFELETFIYGKKIVAVSDDLDKLRKYALLQYSSNDDPEFDKEIEVVAGKTYRYENRGGQYQGSGYKQHGLIETNLETKDIIVVY